MRLRRRGNDELDREVKQLEAFVTGPGFQWGFDRSADGRVLLTKRVPVKAREGGYPGDAIVESVSFGAGEWAEIVAQVSRAGMNEDTINAAFAHHMGTPEPVVAAGGRDPFYVPPS